MIGVSNGIYYKVWENPSSNENLVFVHGSGCNHKFLKALAKKLKKYNCYMLDLPGHGKSKNGNYSCVEEYIDAVAEFVCDLSNVTLVGHSLGGTICLGIAAKNLISVKKSVILSSGAVFDKLDYKIHEMVRRGKVNWLYLLKCLGSLWNPLVLLACLTFEKPSIILQDFKMDIELNIVDRISDSEGPMLIMVGDNDILTPPEYSHRIKKAVKNSQLILIEGVKHMLPIAKRRDVARYIAQFVEDNIS